MAEIGIFVGTVYGNSLLVAEEAQRILSEQGHQSTVFEEPSLQDWQRYDGLYIRSLFSALQDAGWQPTMRYGLIALGDSSYERFCQAGKQFDALLQEQGASRIGELLTIDATEHPEPEMIAIPWLEAWASSLSD